MANKWLKTLHMDYDLKIGNITVFDNSVQEVTAEQYSALSSNGIFTDLVSKGAISVYNSKPEDTAECYVRSADGSITLNNIPVNSEGVTNVTVAEVIKELDNVDANITLYAYLWRDTLVYTNKPTLNNGDNVEFLFRKGLSWLQKNFTISDSGSSLTASYTPSLGEEWQSGSNHAQPNGCNSFFKFKNVYMKMASSAGIKWSETYDGSYTACTGFISSDASISYLQTVQTEDLFVLSNNKGAWWTDDGKSFTSLTSEDETFSAINVRLVFHTTIWILVDSSGNVWKSQDGKVYTKYTSNISVSSTNTYEANGMLFTTNNSSAYWSTDAETWTAVTSNVDNLLRLDSVAYVGTRYIAAAYTNKSYLAYSIDGKEWQVSSNAISGNYAFSDNVFIVFGYSPYLSIAYSFDGEHLHTLEVPPLGNTARVIPISSDDFMLVRASSCLRLHISPSNVCYKEFTADRLYGPAIGSSNLPENNMCLVDTDKLILVLSSTTNASNPDCSVSYATSISSELTRAPEYDVNAGA